MGGGFGQRAYGHHLLEAAVISNYAAGIVVGKVGTATTSGDAANSARYERYKSLGDASGVIFGGRLGSYCYYDMDQVIEPGGVL